MPLADELPKIITVIIKIFIYDNIKEIYEFSRPKSLMNVSNSTKSQKIPLFLTSCPPVARANPVAFAMKTKMIVPINSATNSLIMAKK